MQVTVTYKLSLDELRRALTAIGRKHRRITIWIVVPVMLVAGVINVAIGEVGFGTFGVVLGVFYLLALAAGPGKAAAKNAHRICIPMEVSFTETAFATRSALSTAELRWESLVKTEETSEFFLFYISDRVAHIFPKRAFTTDDAAQLRSFLTMGPLAASHQLRPGGARNPQAARRH